jgi:hypothetical protein
MDEESIQRHVYPWQQVLTFFARTQLPHDWKSPGYDFTARQRQKWQRLWAAVQVADVVLAVEEELQPWIMTAREQACLEFCVELLNQRQRSHEYDSALVCAMAVLDRSEQGWRTADSYPPILYKVIKIALFFIVQKALWLDPAARQIIDLWRKKQTDVPWALTSADDGLEDLDEGYVSGTLASSPAPSSISDDPRSPVMDRSRASSGELLREPSSEGFGTPVYPS